jgi:hypothetical protein
MTADSKQYNYVEYGLSIPIDDAWFDDIRNVQIYLRCKMLAKRARKAMYGDMSSIFWHGGRAYSTGGNWYGFKGLGINTGA